MGGITSSPKHRPFPLLAAKEATLPLVMDVRGDSEITREPELGDTFNGGAQVLGGPITVDVGEEIRRFDGVIADPRIREFVRGRDWRSSCEMVPGESKAIETSHLRS